MQRNYACNGQHHVDGERGCNNAACRGKQFCDGDCLACPDFLESNKHCRGRHPADGAEGCHNPDCRGKKCCVASCTGCPDANRTDPINTACQGNHSADECGNPRCKGIKFCQPDCYTCPDYLRQVRTAKSPQKVTLYGRLTFIPIWDCNNSGNSAEESLSVHQAITMNFSTTTFRQELEKSELKITDNMTKGGNIGFTYKGLTMGGSTNSTTDRVDYHYRELMTQVTNKMDYSTTKTVTWTFKVGPDSHAVFYRAACLTPSGAVDLEYMVQRPPSDPPADQVLEFHYIVNV